MLRKTLLFALAIVSIPSIGAYAASVANITLTGTVPQVFRIVVNETGNGQGLDLSLNGDVKLADVINLTNSPTGFTTTITSGNVFAGNCPTPCLFSPSTLDAIPIILERDTTALSFTGDTATYEVTASRGASNTELHMSFVGDELATEAIDYTESLTLTIGVN